jgi:hypothetical protein
MGRSAGRAFGWPRAHISLMVSRKRPDWSRPLPQPLQIIDENDKLVLTLQTLGDLRTMLLGLPEAFQSKTTWGTSRSCLTKPPAAETSSMSWCRCAWCSAWKASRPGQSDPVPRHDR